MKLLTELRDEDIGLKSKRQKKLKQRFAARAVLLNKDKIALLHVTKQKYHKLPGGGVESEEKIKDALFREILEETGCKIKIIGDVGKIIEHKTHLNIKQTSYCYFGKVIKEGEPKFDKGEIESGFKLEWVDIDSAVKILKKEKPQDYEDKFIVLRDLKFIETVKRQLLTGRL